MTADCFLNGIILSLYHVRTVCEDFNSQAVFAFESKMMGRSSAYAVERWLLYTELQSAVHAMIQRLEYSFTFNPTLLTIPKRKQQVAEILEEAEKYIWRIKEEMRCA